MGTRISTSKVHPHPNKIMRGQMWWADIPHDKCNPHAQHGFRPVVVISNNRGNAHSPSLLVCPLTTQQDKYSFIHPNVMCDGTLSYVQCEQIKVLDKSLLGGYIGRVREVEQKYIDKALAVSIDLSEYIDGFHANHIELETAKNSIASLQSRISQLEKENAEYKSNEEMLRLGHHVKGIIDILFKSNEVAASQCYDEAGHNNIPEDENTSSQPDELVSSPDHTENSVKSQKMSQVEKFNKRYEKYEQFKSSEKVEVKSGTKTTNSRSKKWNDATMKSFIEDYKKLSKSELLNKYNLKDCKTACTYYGKFKKLQSL